MSKREEGRDEPIIDQQLPIIDTHHHFYDQPTMHYMFEDFLADVGAGHDIKATVYVSTQTMTRANGPVALRPVGEIEFANGVAAMSASGAYGPCRVAAAIIGYADLTTGDQVAELLDRSISSAPDRFRGIRQSALEPQNDNALRFSISAQRPARGVLRSPGIQAGLRQLADRGLTFDTSVFHHQIPELASVADKSPDTTIVLGHMGGALGMDMSEQDRSEVFKTWRKALRDLARRPNVICKVGGLGMPFWGFGFETRSDPVGYLELARAWSPYVETAIDTFGAGRCIMEGNFPPDGRSCGYVPLWNALKHIVREYSEDEKYAMFYANAARVYRISAADS